MRREPLGGGITRVTLPSGTVKYEARASITGPDGTRTNEKRRFRTLKEARSYKARVEGAKAEGRYNAPSRLTVAEYAEVWFARRERAWATSTAEARRRDWERLVKPRFGRLRLVDVTRPMCQQFADELAAKYKPTTLSSYLAPLVEMLHGAARDGHIIRNPAERLDLPRREGGRPKVTWTAAHVARFLAATVDHPDHALYQLVLATGCRIGEALALTWANVDLDGATAHLEATLRRDMDGMRRPAAGTKANPAGRTVPLTPSCVAALRDHRERQGELRRAAKRWDVRGYVFAEADGSYTRYEYAQRRLRTAQGSMGDGWPVITFHAMRHLVATLLRRAGVDSVVIRDLLGHKSYALTADVYTSIDAGDLAEAAAVLANVVASPSENASKTG